MARAGRDLELLVAHLEHILADTPVEIISPYLVYDHVGGIKREVDVAVRGVVNGVESLMAFECRDRTRVEDIAWIEQLVTKKRHTRVDIIVAVSSRGFSAAASRVATAAGIRLRVLEEVSRADVYEWMGAETMEVRLRTFQISGASISLDPDCGHVEIHQNAKAALETPTDDTPVLLSKQSGRPVSLHEAWLALGPQPFELQILSGERRNLDLAVAFMNPATRYQLETDIGPVDIVKIIFSGLFYVIDQKVPIDKVYRYQQGDTTLSERITFAFDNGTTPMNLTFDRTEDGRLFSVSATSDDGSPATTPVALELVFDKQEP
ncbi:hypothetical protein AB0B66_10140 [Catellatospora sp. NPDC049111]|uniref:hypothetical protein n=1 Tax=Catellatospora sp. NPDC049111 TaxID=3155271 RepID=UPI0033C9F250